MVLLVGAVAIASADAAAAVSGAPSVEFVSPSSGSVLGGTEVSLFGSGFTEATSIRFGANPVVAPSHLLDDSDINVTAPAGVGTVDITVTSALGTSATSGADQYTYVAATAPTVTQLSPSSGVTAGGTSVEIGGTGFVGATSVHFGTRSAESFDVSDDEDISAIAPAGTGTVAVTVTTAVGTSPTNPTDLYTYLAPTVPTVTSISPSTGTAAGGTSVSLFGTGFLWATSVHFGTHVATNVQIEDDNDIFLTAPAGSGTVAVTVTTPAGTSTSHSADEFTYVAPTAPTVTLVSPSSGSGAGGTNTNVFGTGFTGTTSVHFGTSAATNVQVISDSFISATTPAGAGIADVTVTTPLGTSPATADDEFTYIAPTVPTVTEVYPPSGTTAGGTSVGVIGTDFIGVTAVHFGTRLASDVQVEGDNNLFADAPPGTGTVDITVTTALGTSGLNAPFDEFTYVAPTAPTVTSISPSSGTGAGGTDVQINGTDFTGATSVHFGTHAVTNLNVFDDAVSALAPPGVGTVDVTVTTPLGTSAINANDEFTYIAPTVPTVTSVSPFSGSTAGGTVVSIVGTDFTGTTAVHFGSHPATNVGVADDNDIDATAPPGSGAVDVTVTTSLGTSATNPLDTYTYVAPTVPTVTSVSPTSGTGAGGSLVVIDGTGFTGTTAVHFGSQTVTNVQANSDTTILAAAPPGTGTVDVTVTTPLGTSTIGPFDQYTYVDPGAPTVFSVYPSSGSSAGGTRVEVGGTNLAGATSVSFGGRAATSFQVNNDNVIFATSPSGTGTVDVTVTTPVGVSTIGSADHYSYVGASPAPTITRVSPATGPTIGGTKVAISGTNLTAATSVVFGVKRAVFTVTAGQILANAPSGTVGTVNVRVTTAGGTSPVSVADRYSYTQPASEPGSGYAMLGADGTVYAFGDAPKLGNAPGPAIAMAARADGRGYWIVDAAGNVSHFGTAGEHGGHPALRSGERVSTISATPSGNGYWLFTNFGRAFAYGDARSYGDLGAVHLNGPVVASVATPSGHGYYMVASDGGVFSFGDARFHGSMGSAHLNRPIVGLSPTPDGRGYWLVASDGGVFAFGAPFRGSMGSVTLARPVNGLVAYGDGYLMVASDGGVFDFSNRAFVGSLGNDPPAAPIIGIAAFGV